jgi:hypothetical protein
MVVQKVFFFNCKYRYTLAKDGHKKYPKHIQRKENQYKKQGNKRKKPNTTRTTPQKKNIYKLLST